VIGEAIAVAEAIAEIATGEVRLKKI